MRSVTWILAAFVLSLLTWAPAVAQGKRSTVARPVLDDANLFSKEAEDKANTIIAKIKSQSHKDFFVETVPNVPLPEGVKDPAAIDKFVSQWAIDRFKTFEIDGVYLLITKNPPKLRIEIGPTTLKEGWFTSENRNHLKTILKDHLGSEPDKTLLVSANYVLDTMAKHATTTAKPNHVTPAADPGHQQPQQQARDEGFPPWLIWVGVGLGALLIFWLIMGLARAASGGGGYGGAPGMGGGGGGGFMSSMLGGLFGAAAGMYLYNNFFGGHGSSAHAGDSSAGAGTGGDAQESTDVGAGDPSGEGADWGDNGNAGGGDAGGGDWGGGGGGDWGGGGGGDWGGGGGGDW